MKITVPIYEVLEIVEKRFMESPIRLKQGSGKLVYEGCGGDVEVTSIEFELDQSL